MRTIAPLFAVAVTLPFLGACEDIEVEAPEEPVAFAEASLRLETAADCEAAFSGGWLSRLADHRAWTDDDVATLCDELIDIADAYAEDTTMTTVAMAGAATLADEGLDSSWYVGVSAYNLSEIRAWTEAAQGANAVRTCVRDARESTRAGQDIGEGFARDCMEDVTGQSFPEPIFQQRRSTLGLEEIGDEATGAAMGLAIYNIPGEGTVVAFLGGGFYAQAEPAYGAFIGCGAAIGFDADRGESDSASLCTAAEF